MSKCKSETRSEHGVWGPREWYLEQLPETFKGHLDILALS